MNKNKFENGSVKISNDIFYMISAIATMEVEGVRSIVGLSSDLDRVTAKNSKKGIDIEFLDDGLIISTKVSVEYGKKFEELVKNIQENIKLKVEVMTSIKVNAVNVLIESVEK
ncbi:MAG: Asp23/Gls24 family envelope stress response protein [Peptoniphilaceae bacterium]|uniref:Asp23/Gls24 family envelope stress response protein n=1 Tax=Parvimonas sp. TaxID=1944660 RepID=UPI0025FF0E7B|nr:Asp23/Gls24 family envelope stress response protein [Parvimonas sp.]MCI5997569.1 Asp23/Gls24 family envelope stress response protein [Parvimonas sp.]MDD7765164.1 Asp23/Gls24 family envelope stress response protein [Peptoniphilaceae bacterium]MDY3051219.1 Asp23/Gls24 family envelope stress response protein [Parvimonas sp.]